MFLIVNSLIVLTISIFTNILGIGNYLKAEGIDYNSLLLFCLFWGMAGSLISLFMSRFIAKKAMGVQVINTTNSGEYYFLTSIVTTLSRNAGIPTPEVGVYESEEMNAFATGPSKKKSLVAVSTGLLQRMNNKELEGVIGHEIAHIANGDMVTMTLLQGAVNAFAMFISRILGFFAGKFVKEDLEYIVRTIITIVFDIVFSLLGSLFVAYFSRLREFKADSDSAKIAGKENMIAALESLKANYIPLDTHGSSLATFKISNKKSILSIFSTHPPLEARINALRSTS
jgi:heat shock protein HtpX